MFICFGLGFYLIVFGLLVFRGSSLAEKEIAVKRIGIRSHSDRVTNPVIKRAASANVSYSFELRRQKDYLFFVGVLLRIRKRDSFFLLMRFSLSRDFNRLCIYSS